MRDSDAVSVPVDVGERDDDGRRCDDGAEFGAEFVHRIGVHAERWCEHDRGDGDGGGWAVLSVSPRRRARSDSESMAMIF
jgi:hypothetical protein